MDTYGKITWENALYEARRYHAKKMSSRYNEGIDYDESGEIFDNFPFGSTLSLLLRGDEKYIFFRNVRENGRRGGKVAYG